jgi:anti-sigma regulatory factor (Ser/Thr protein kinase)
VPLARSELVAALDALLGNVFRYTPQGTAFEVAVSRKDGYVALRVDDAGPGIDDPDRALRRGSSDRGSTGLGLDIVRRAAIAGHGSVDIARSALGGASVVVLLADAERPSAAPRQRLGFVGRLAREPDEKPWRRRLRAPRLVAARRSSAAAGRAAERSLPQEGE